MQLVGQSAKARLDSGTGVMGDEPGQSIVALKPANQARAVEAMKAGIGS